MVFAEKEYIPVSEIQSFSVTVIFKNLPSVKIKESA
jgi:hypothetical protein